MFMLPISTPSHPPPQIFLWMRIRVLWEPTWTLVAWLVGGEAFEARWCDTWVSGPIGSGLTRNKTLAVLQQGLEGEEKMKVYKSEPVHRGGGCWKN